VRHALWGGTGSTGAGRGGTDGAGPGHQASTGSES